MCAAGRGKADLTRVHVPEGLNLKALAYRGASIKCVKLRISRKKGPLKPHFWILAPRS